MRHNEAARAPSDGIAIWQTVLTHDMVGLQFCISAEVKLSDCWKSSNAAQRPSVKLQSGLRILAIPEFN